VKLHAEGICEVRTTPEGLSLTFLLLLVGARAVANQPGGKITRSKKQHAYRY
jgi:hypothetical protein